MAWAHRLLTPSVSTISLYPFPVRIPTGSSLQNRPPPIVRREKNYVPFLVVTTIRTAIILLVSVHISYLLLKIHPQPVDVLINFIPINFVSR